MPSGKLPLWVAEWGDGGEERYLFLKVVVRIQLNYACDVLGPEPGTYSVY